MAGFYKTGKLGDVAVLNWHFENWALKTIDSWGMHLGCTGKPPQQLQQELATAGRFIWETAKQLFPLWVQTSSFQQKFHKTLMTQNAYFAESTWWRNRNPDQIAMCHNNLNVDNAF